MRPMSIYVFTPSTQAADVIRAAAEASHCKVVIEIGDITHAAAVARDWSATPEILMLDVSEEADQEAAIDKFAQAAPQGETSLIIVGRGGDIRTYRNFKQMGAMEYIAAPVEQSEVAHVLEVVRRAISTRQDTADPSKLILVTSARGGAGSSTVAGELARGIAGKHGRRTLLIDLDVDGGCQHSMFNVEPTRGFGLMLDAPEAADALLLNRTLTRTAERNLSLLSDIMEDPTRFQPTAPGNIANAVARDFDAVVFDVPARSPYFRDLSGRAATLVIVAPPTFHGLRETLAQLDIAEKTGGVRKAIVVINKLGEFRSGFVGPEAFKQHAQKGSRPEFRQAIKILTLPYAPKQAIRVANTSEPMMDDAGTPIAKALATVLAELPTAPVARKRSGLFSMIIGS